MEPTPTGLSDKIAYGLTMSFRWFADTFFAKRYGHRAVVLETVAGVPGMVAGMWQHLRSLRKMKPDERGWIKTLLDEAENERMHLMIFIEIAKPNWFERLLVLFAQFVFWHFYFVLYVFFPKTAHRMIGYFENQAVVSYTQYLDEIDSGRTENIPAPKIAIDYYTLKPNATLRDVIIAVRLDEQGHADVNHQMADELISK
jgi:ubiquinol oxidase